MSVMYIRNEQTGEFEPVPSLVGPQGPPGSNGDGAGTVTSVNKVAPDAAGNVTLTAEDVGALPSDGTAANAALLNGKDAKYYLSKRNLSDNSNFRNMVNQREVTSAASGEYLIDRWIAFGGDASISMASDGSTISGKLMQRVPASYFTNGKQYTVALYYSDGTAICAYGMLNTSHLGQYIDVANDGNSIVALSIRGSSEYLEVTIAPEKKVLGVALYEGTYTADNLPPYTPKGYAAELAECRRYYQVITYDQVGLTVVSQRLGDGFRGSMQIDPMRINAPTATMSYTNTIIAAGGTNINIAEMTATVNGTTLSISGTAETALTSGGAGLLYGNLTGNKIEISADL